MKIIQGYQPDYTTSQYYGYNDCGAWFTGKTLEYSPINWVNEPVSKYFEKVNHAINANLHSSC